MLLLAIASFSLQAASPQIGSVDVANRLASRLVELFNKDDASGIASLAEPGFFKTIPAGQLPTLVSRMHSLGTFSVPNLTLDLTERRHYRIVVSRDGQPDREIEMVVGAGGERFYSLGFAPIKPSIPGKKPLATDNPRKSGLDQAVQASVERFAEKNPTVGLSVGVIDGDRKAVYNYGEVVAGGGSRPTSKTIYEIGSITKAMTGLLVAQAVVDRKLELDTDIRKYLPGSFPNLEFEGKPVTVRHLVTHTTGLPANPPGIPDDGKADAYERFSHRELLANLAAIKLTEAPGSKFSYSNMGAGLFAPMLERVYEEPFETLLKKRLFGPAGMPHSGLALTPSMEKAYATPYDTSGAKTDRWIVNGIEAAGGVRSSAEDMLSYARFNLDERNRAVSLSHKLQSPEGLKPTGIFWGKGDSRLGGAYLNHEGGTGGFTSHVLVMPTPKLAVVVLTNVGEVETGGLAYEIALRVLASKLSRERLALRPQVFHQRVNAYRSQALG